jgi:tetratricopeptide (TPR) repeat protein
MRTMNINNFALFTSRRHLSFLIVLSVVFVQLMFHNQLYSQTFQSVIPAAGQGNPNIRSLSDAAIDRDGNVYLVDERVGGIQIFSESGAFLEHRNLFINGLDTVRIATPSVITIGPRGLIYVADGQSRIIHVIDKNNIIHSFGGRGSGPGEFRNIISIAVDSDAYVYVLDDSNNKVEIYDDHGNYLTWITGPQKNPARVFNRPVSIGVDTSNQIYVAESDPAQIHVFNVSGGHLYSITEIGGTESQISSIKSMAVFPNGEFAVINSDGGSFSIHSNRGQMIHRAGRVGRDSSPGIFRNPESIISSGEGNKGILILDAGANNLQRYHYEVTSTDAKPSEKIRVIPINDIVPSFHDAVFAPNGNLYYIPANDNNKIVVMDLESGRELFSLRAQHAHRIATDPDSRIYVLDIHRRAREVSIYNSEGHFLYNVGQDMDNPLTDPEGLAVLSDGSVLVSDRRQQIIHKWSAGGVYSGVAVRMDQAQISSVGYIRTDSDNHIYVLEAAQKAIFRFSPLGLLIDAAALTVYGSDPARGNAEINWFDIDSAGNIHVFNNSVNEYQIFSWLPSLSVLHYPVSMFRFGYDGSGKFGFTSIRNITLNKNNLHVYVMNDRGRELKSFRIQIRPPKTDFELAQFSIRDNYLSVKLPKTGDGNISGYGVGYLDPETQEPVIIGRGEEDFFAIVNERQTEQPQTYYLFSIGSGGLSEPSEPFIDYIGAARQSVLNGNYAAALDLYTRAVTYYNKDEDFNHIVFEQFLEWSRELTNRRQSQLVTSIIAQSAALVSDSDYGNTQIVEILRTLFGGMARRAEFDLMQSSLNNLIQIDRRAIIIPVSEEILNATAGLIEAENESRINQGLVLLNQLAVWTSRDPGVLKELARGNVLYYRYLQSKATPHHVLTFRLGQASPILSEAVGKMTLVNDLYNEIRLLQLEVFNESAQYALTVEVSEKELSEQVPGLGQNHLIRYRILLGTALMAQGNWNAAIFNYTELVNLQASNSQFQKLLGRTYIAAARFDEARSIYRQLVISQPDNHVFLAGLGEAESGLGNYAEASFQFERALELAPGNSRYFGLIGNAYFADGKYSEAVVYLSDAVIGLQGRLSQAVENQSPPHVQRAILAELEPLLHAAGRSYIRLRDFDNAVLNLHALTDLNTSNPMYWYELGLAYQGGSRFYDAEGAFFRATTLELSNNEFRRAYSQARSSSEQFAATRPAVEITEIRLIPIFPSLYRNYSGRQSVGNVLVLNNTESVVVGAQLQVLTSRFTSDPYVINLPSLPPRSSNSVALYINLSEDILQNTEDLTAQLSIDFVWNNAGEQFVSTVNENVTVHRRSAISWSDKRRLASFISPGNVEIRNYLTTINAGFRQVQSYGLPGNIVSALRVYTALNTRGIVYQRDPNMATLLEEGLLDDIQFPLQTLMIGSGECDDFVTLFSNLFESQGIRSAYIDVPGHVFVAFDTELSTSDLLSSGLNPVDFIIQNDRVWLPLETTLVGTADFLESWQSAIGRWITETTRGNFPQLVPFENASRVYLPAEVIPDEVSLQPNIDSDGMNIYRNVLERLFAIFNEARLETLLDRLRNEPGNVSILNEYGVLMAQTGQYESAANLFNNALNQVPHSAQIHNNLGNIYYLQRDYLRALYHYRQSAENAPENVAVLMNKVRTHLARRDREEAERIFELAREIDPQKARLFQPLLDTQTER